MGKGLGSGEGTGLGCGDGAGGYKGKTKRVAVPAMPMPVAAVCCVLNFIFPGLGTMIAGLSNFCCARNEDMDTGSRMGSCCVSLGIGCLQLLTTALCLIGWGWSCVWGVFFIGMSSEYYHNNRVEDTDGRGGVVISNPRVVVAHQPGVPGTIIHQPIAPQYGQPLPPGQIYGQPSTFVYAR